MTAIFRKVLSEEIKPTFNVAALTQDDSIFVHQGSIAPDLECAVDGYTLRQSGQTSPNWQKLNQLRPTSLALQTLLAAI